MTRGARLVVLLLALTAPAPLNVEGQTRADGTAPSADAASAPFTLGVLRRDGLVLPFAAFNGRRWLAPWPAGLAFIELPISLDSIEPGWWGRGVPAPKAMTIWADGKPRGDITLGNPSFLSLLCGSRRIALKTNYHAAEVPPPLSEQPYPKDGLVVAGPQQIEVIERVAQGSAEWRDATVAIAKEFNEEENYATGAFTSWRHPVRRPDRERVPIEIESLYRAPMDEPGWTAYYVEAVRKFPPGKDDADDCGLLTTARGFLRMGPKGERRVELGAQVTYCDRYGLTYMLPLGLVRAGGGAYWVYQIAGYQTESYVIVRPMPGRVERVVGYPVGMCPW